MLDTIWVSSTVISKLRTLPPDFVWELLDPSGIYLRKSPWAWAIASHAPRKNAKVKFVYKCHVCPLMALCLPYLFCHPSETVLVAQSKCNEGLVALAESRREHGRTKPRVAGEVAGTWAWVGGRSASKIRPTNSVSTVSHAHACCDVGSRSFCGYIGGILIWALMLIVTLYRKATSLRKGMFRYNELLDSTAKVAFTRQAVPIAQLLGDGH